MVKNIVSNTKFYCVNPIHEKPVLMTPRKRSDDSNDNFFACPKYMLKEEKYPDGHELDERACHNRISFSEAGDIIVEFNKIVDEDLTDGVIGDYRDLTFTYKNNIKVTVLRFNDGELHLGVVNRRATEH